MADDDAVTDTPIGDDDPADAYDAGDGHIDRLRVIVRILEAARLRRDRAELDVAILLLGELHDDLVALDVGDLT